MNRRFLRCFGFLKVLAVIFFGSIGSGSLSLAQVESKHSGAQKPWTYFFLIQGDNDYGGTDFKNGKAHEVDFAWRQYKTLKRIAENDPVNSYVIYFDPRGQSSWTFVETTSHQDVYVRGMLWRTMDRRRELNSVSPDEIHQWIDSGVKALDESRVWDLADTHRLFYYYGERIPTRSTSGYDESAPNAMFDIARFSAGLEPFEAMGGVDVVFFHSCDAADMRLLTPIAESLQPDFFVLPVKKIHRAPLVTLERVLKTGGTAADMSSAFVNQPEEPYQHHLLRLKTENVVELGQIIAQWKMAIKPLEFKKAIAGVFDAMESSNDPNESSGTSSIAAQKVGANGDRIIKLTDFLLLLDQLAEPPASMVRLEALLAGQPTLKQLGYSFSPTEIKGKSK